MKIRNIILIIMFGITSIGSMQTVFPDIESGLVINNKKTISYQALEKLKCYKEVVKTMPYKKHSLFKQNQRKLVIGSSIISAYILSVAIRGYQAM